jgi:chemotaxis protein MotD
MGVRRAKTSTDAPSQRASSAASTTATESAGAVAGRSAFAKSDDPSTHGDSKGGDSAPSAATLTTASASTVSTDASAAVSVSGSLDQLPDLIADAADDLAGATQSAGAAASASTAQPVKELQIDLSPAELGSLTVTMRLVSGKLSVVVAVANPSTLKAIESDRDAIAARLGAAASSLDTLVIQPMRAVATGAADSAGDGQSSTRENSANGDNRDPSSGGQSSARRDAAAEAWRRQSAASRRSAGDLTV